MGGPHEPGIKPSAYDRDNLRYQRRKYKIEYAEKDISDGNLYASERIEQLMPEFSILFIRPEEHPAEKIERALLDEFNGEIEWTRVEALFDGLRALQDRRFDLIISDLFLPDGQGLATLHHLNQQAPQTPVIVLCKARDRDTAVSAVRKGAHDFFCYDDPDVTSLRRAVSGVLKHGETDKESSGADRRTNARFPCKLAVSYQALEHPFFSGTATSETVNISSKGLLFATEEALQPGQLLQVSVDWPARLENQVPLKLVAEGRIVRNLNGQAAMRIDKYEFRPRRARPDSSEAGRTADSRKSTTPLNRPPETAAVSSRPGTAAGSRTDGGRTRRNA
jgi:DNA-binding NarL/FixJ family response regulator